MHSHPHPSSALSFLVLGLVACSGPSVTGEHTPEDGGSSVSRDGPNEHALVPPPPAQPVSVGFSRHFGGGLAAFDRQSGAVLATHALPGAIVDLAWHPRREQLLVVRTEGALDACAVEALRFGEGGFEPVATSEPLSGSVRVHVWGERVLAFAEEIGTSWWLLDETLQAEAPGKALFRPAGLAPAPGGDALFGLDAHRYENGTDEDAIVRLGFTGQWQLEEWPLPAPGRPASRLADSTEPDTFWLVRKLDPGNRFELAEIDALAPVAPASFVHVTVPVTGSLQGVVVEPIEQALVATLSNDVTGGAGAVALLSLVPGGTSSAFELGAKIESSPWPARHLAWDPVTFRVLVATGSGVEAFVAAGTEAAPALAEDASFDGGELRPPLALRGT